MLETYLFALFNMVICIGIICVCLCRLNLMDRRVFIRVRGEYAFYIGGSIISGLQPWWGEWPQWGNISISGSLLFGLIVGGIGWRKGPPESVTGPAPLGNE
jgi:hypothetical protein